MAKRRRNVRIKSRGKTPPKRIYKGSKNRSIKERFLTTAIWGLSLINIVLIVSLVSNFFASPNEIQLTPELSHKADPKPQKNVIITVEVLNACGVQGLANEVTQYLRKQNFDVVNVGNYKGGFNLDRTLIFDRVSLNNIYANEVAAALGVDSKQVVPELEDSLQLMVTVIIGKDYKKLKIFKNKR